ncbi:hypothetical protein PILCRDRAFT_9013 [Piloderma croceum F 1598]|uniref:Thioester reductase (TE) domain-containing protein n=1 Tax=Piloderma croceum (strain F 1598) TaxID=765440 RepID=A0A0C3BUE3_PILCF|nr:hypothetical protein PILCRDRAFT_9013 [Piloderma croceum F 1598]
MAQTGDELGVSNQGELAKGSVTDGERRSIALSCIFDEDQRLHGPHPLANPEPVLSDAQVSYNDIHMLNAIPPQPTLENYVVIGGSGFLGTYSDILFVSSFSGARPQYESSTCIPPSGYCFKPLRIKTDVTSLQSVRDGLTRPFSDGSGLPTVIYHTTALIRFWERASYVWEISHKVNVQGTSNVLSVAKELPNAMIIYTSTADACVPRAKLLRLGLDYKTPPYHKVTISNDDPPLTPSQSSQSCYTRSKVLTERLVIEANEWNAQNWDHSPGIIGLCIISRDWF